MRNKQRVMSGMHLLVLLAMHRQERVISALEVGKIIENATGRSVLRPNLHRALGDLVSKGWADRVRITEEQDGRRHHSFNLSKEGRAQIEMAAVGVLELGVVEVAEQGRRRA